MSGKTTLSAEDMAAVDRHVQVYARERSRYERLAEFVKQTIEFHCDRGLMHATQFRAKEVVSFQNKCKKVNDQGQLKYSVPLSDITDLAGVRVIVFTRDAVDAICKTIEGLFEVRQFEDVGERVYNAGKFGYQSKHILVRLKPGSGAGAPESDRLTCEIQVRTILQHAWAEMEHDIQYKSAFDIPKDLSKRFSALAGLLEIADREFAAIQKDSIALKSVVKEDEVSTLTQQGFETSRDDNVDGNEDLAFRNVRDLVSKRMYGDAIAVYTSKIEQEPSAHTLYIGRARTHFLAGNQRDAIRDLDASDKLNPRSEEAIRLRAIIETGDTSLLKKIAPSKLISDQSRAMQALAEGKGIEAFNEYHRLEAEGFSSGFSNLGKAIACAMENDLEGAVYFLSKLEIRPGTPMAVNIHAVEVVIALLRGSAADETRVEESLKQAPQYNIKMTPLEAFREGMTKHFPAKHPANKFLRSFAQHNAVDRGEAPATT